MTLNQLNWNLKYALPVMLATATALSQADVSIPNTPLVTQIITPPMVMLVASKDHKLFVEAYNDASDLDGDGKLDRYFKPSITYYGLFDPAVCYSDNGSGKGNSGLFTPAAAAGTLGKCSTKWSGNWLNYMTTSRIDSLRKVLYGGYREVDSTTDTVLRRAYIPQDGHSWAKEYTSETVDGYKISDYTPLSEPSSGKRHFFGNLTANNSTNCATLDTCSNLPPLLRIRGNVGDDRRVWEWASKERVVLNDQLADGTDANSDADPFPTGTDAEKNYTIRVQVCTSAYHTGCKAYGSVFKPIGILHDYGENDAMLFGLLTGSYNKNMSGGVLRKIIGSFQTEVNASTGQFTADATIVQNFNKLRIRDFNNGGTGASYRKGSFRTGPMAEGDYPDWGNPVGEMMYESLRYFAGKKTATSVFNTSASHDGAVGLSRVATWNDPFTGATTDETKALRCARPNMLVMSDVYPSYDADQMPGSPYSTLTDDIGGLNANTLLTQISNTEPGVKGLRFIGQSTTSNLDYAPTAKTVDSLATVRGLAPEETTKQGSYSAAAIAYFGRVNDISASTDDQKVSSYMLALSSTLPKIDIPINGKTISIVPFAKTVDGASTNRTEGYYQPTDQIVDLYVTKDDLTGATKQMVFQINYEADEQGNDYDMDVQAEYTVTANSDNTVTVSVEVKYEATGSNQNVGYVISGTNRDGIYLVAQDKNEELGYFLNVPPGRDAGYCRSATNLAKAECKKLPYLGSATPKSTQIFSTGANTAGEFLRDPLWYAAKWGGFNDKDNNKLPNLTSEWDSDGNGVPDNYFLVQNPLFLGAALKNAFANMADADSSASNVLANSTSISNSTRVFQARFNANRWSGDLVAYPIATTGVSTTPEWQAQNAMPTPALRKILVRTTADTTTDFVWSGLTTSDKALFDADPSSTDNSQDVVDYLRGVRSKEIKNGGTFRDRVNLATDVAPLGDIVHSSPFYEKDSDMLYVSANDGMLHAFRATAVKDSSGNITSKAGSEVFAFIPSEVLSRLKNLTSAGYTHDFFVDGDVTVSPKSTETGNKHLLFAALGRGGKGLFGLNVTTPNSFASADFLWEYTPTGDSSATTDGVLDTTTNASTDQDLGFMLGRPVFANMNNGKAAVIIGNGYNSTSGKAVLYIFLLNTSGQVTEVKKIDTLASGNNGLATPGVFDSNADGKVDYIYAGDLSGNLWKFDVSSTNTSSWTVGLSGSPLFVAKDATNNPQPITAPVTIVKNEVSGDTHEGKRFVFFGSGSYFRSGDSADDSKQSWYGIIDENASINNRSALKQRSISISGTFAGKPVRAFATAATGDMVSMKGWYIDFTNPSGERIVTEPLYYKLAKPALVGSSIIPAVGDPCTPGGTGYVNIINPFDGGAISIKILDANDNNNYTDDLISGASIGSIDLGVGMPSRPTLIGNQLVVGGTKPTKPIASVRVNPGTAPLKGRISWREIVRD